MRSKLYRRRPPEVEAIQWDGTPTGFTGICQFCTAVSGAFPHLGRVVASLTMDTYLDINAGRSFRTRLLKGDWLAHDLQWGLVRVPAALFEALYEEIREIPVRARSGVTCAVCGSTEIDELKDDHRDLYHRCCLKCRHVWETPGVQRALERA